MTIRNNNPTTNNKDDLVASIKRDPDWRLDSGRVLLVARESSTGAEAKILLRNLFATVLRGAEKHLVRLPDFEAVVAQYDNPGPDARVFESKGSRAVLIRTPECDVLLSLGSARKLDEAGDNAFVGVLVDVLKSGSYSHVLTTTISRLIRNTVKGGVLEQVLAQNRTAVVLGSHTIKVWEELDKLLWSLFVWFATFEAQQIETRLIAGKLSRAAKGQWCFGFAPPPGWRRLEDGTVQVDPLAADALRWLIRFVANTDSSWREIGRIFTAQWPEVTLRKGAGRLADSSEAGEVLKRTWLNPRWFDAYLNEAHTITLLPGGIIPEASDRFEDEEARESAIAAGTIRFELPPQAEPLARMEDLQSILDRRDAEEQASTVRALPNSQFGSGMSWSFDEGTVDSRLLDPLTSESEAGEEVA